jgi:glycosyltransferase involved in cell wall biosynthesis
MPLRLRIFVSHPVQYHVPLWRALAAHPELDLKVFYFNDQGLRGGVDEGFGIPVTWDVDMLSGYDHAFISRDADLSRPGTIRLEDPVGLLRSEHADWVMIAGYMRPFERQLVKAAKRVGARVLLRGEFCDLSEFQRGIIKSLARDHYLRWFYRRVDAFAYPGELGRQHLVRLGVPKERMFFSPYSVDHEFLLSTVQGMTRDSSRRALGIPEDRFVILFSGKLIPRKDPLLLLDAIEALPDRSRVGLIILGDGELREEVTRRAQALLDDRFIFPGFVNQSGLGNYFLASDVLVLPSRFETWGLVVNEGMHFGLPSIVSDRVGCHPDLVIPGVTGWVYPHGEAAMLAVHLESASASLKESSLMRACETRSRNYSIRESASGVFKALGVAAESLCS